MKGFNQFLIKKDKETKTKGVFSVGPLFGGFGYTVGNGLRRTLLSCLSGLAVTQIKVKGATHVFASIPGVKEDLIEVVLNIKQIKIKSSKAKSFKMNLDKTGPGEVKAGDIKVPAEVEIANKDLVLANLADKKSRLKIDFQVDQGVGYSLADEHKEDKFGVISVDAIFNPVVEVSCQVSPVRVGKKTDFDQVTLKIETDGTITPSEALEQSASILTDVFSQIQTPKKVSLPGAVKKKKVKKIDDDLLVEELNLPLRLVNALKKAGYEKIGDFEGVHVQRVLDIKNVGKKSAEELVKVLKSKGVALKEE